MERWALCALFVGLAACAATPDLKFSEDEGDGGSTDGAVASTDATLVDGAMVTPPGDATASDATSIDAGTDPVDATAAPDTFVPDVAVIDSAPPPIDAGAPDSAAVCVANAALGLDCCPNGEQCANLACQHCVDCAACALPNVCCAVVNGGGKYKSMKCAASSVGCP